MIKCIVIDKIKYNIKYQYLLILLMSLVFWIYLFNDSIYISYDMSFHINRFVWMQKSI